MKISSFPFFLVFLSSLLPMAGSFFNIPTYNVPAALVLGALVLAVTSARISVTILFNKNLSWALFLMSAVLISQVLTGRGFVILGAGGYVLAFAFIFYVLFSAGTGISITKIVRGISFLYKFFVVGMIIETLIVIFGQQPLLAKLFPTSGDYFGYKTYNPADIPRLFGLFQDGGGLNSILLGSQIAGMLSLFAAIWFAGIRKSKIRGSTPAGSGLWLGLSLFMLMFSINGTVSLLFVLAIIIYGLFMNHKHRILVFCVMSLVSVGIVLAISAGILFPRIFLDEFNPLVQGGVNYATDRGGVLSDLAGIDTVLGYYIYLQLNPIILWLSLDWPGRLIGAGAQFFSGAEQYISGDFGFGADVLLRSGLVGAIIFVAAVFVICLPALKRPAYGPNDRQSDTWSHLGSINALISLLWLFSTVHYDQALGNPAGVMLFALHLALAIYCRKRGFGEFKRALSYKGLEVENSALTS